MKNCSEAKKIVCLTIWIFLTKILVLLEGQAVFLLTVIHNGYFFEIFIQKPHGFMASLIIFNVILVINLKKVYICIVINLKKVYCVKIKYLKKV